MSIKLKRVTALVLAVLMAWSLCSTGLALDGATASDPVIPGLADGGALLTKVAGQNITVTFVVDHAEYTEDPASGYTHLTAKQPITGGDLTYTSWAGRYKVSGVGTVCSYTIPAGTSLVENGYAAPALSVENIGNTNAHTYSSLVSWVTQSGMIFNANAAFSEDTTFSLQLYLSDNSTLYHLDYVCGEENHTIASGDNLMLGQCVSEASVAAATQKAQAFTSKWCSHGTEHGETLAKWQVKVTGSGDMVDFAAGMPLTEAYVDAQYGNAIKVYAVWETEPEEPEPEPEPVPVTATFVYGETTIETRDLLSGNALGELPDMSAYESEDVFFIGWQYSNGEETLYAAADTVIMADTVYTAVFEELVYCSVIFNDIGPDGEAADISIDLSVEAGKMLAEIITENDAELSDGTLLSACVWYTVDENGVKTPANLNAPVMGDMELYAYTYRIELVLSPAAVAAASVDVEVTPDGEYKLTITVREGETISAADFVVNGVDYSLYTWRDDANNVVDIQNLITNGVTHNVTAISSGTLSSGATTATGIVNFYVSIDETWTLVESKEITAYYFADRDTYSLSSGQLMSVFAPYGFSGLSDGSYKIWHTDTGSNTIWGDRSAFLHDGVVYTQIRRNGVECDVYYLPHGTYGSGAKNDFVVDNTFYTMSVMDPVEKVYTAQTLPKTVYAAPGNAASMTVDGVENVTWQCIGQNGTEIPGVSNEDDTITFSVESMTQPYEISPVLRDDETILIYDIALTEVPADAEYGRPRIEGQDTYSMMPTEATHQVLRPSPEAYFFSNGKYLGEAVFQGWAVNGNTTSLLQPDDVLDVTGYRGQTVRLTAQWQKVYGGTTQVHDSSLVNFFVSLAALPEGSTSWVGSTETSAFTKSVYTTDCGVTGRTATTQYLYATFASQYYVLGGTSGTDLNENHETITSKLSAGYSLTGYDNNVYTYTGSFPSDESVLRTVRNMVKNGTDIRINNRQITTDELNTTNFTVRWYVFKFDNTDGWHIDGVLVAKKGKMIVKKTFAGDDATIEAVKADYQIQVSGGTVNTGGVLKPSNATSVSGNTYTWEVPVDQFYDYSITEWNYRYDDALYTTNTIYRVHHANDSAQNTGGWVSYTDNPVTVTGQGYNESDSKCLTVEFVNTYTAPGTVIIRKIDAATGNMMPGVDFTIAKADGSSFTMYDMGNSHYSAQAGNGTPTTTITTDSTGQAYLWIGGGSYTLHERVATGYDDPGTITMQLQGVADNAYKVVSITSASASNDRQAFVSGVGSLTLTVRNYSRVIDLKVSKVWENGENKPVTIQLYRNGRPMGSAYTVTFDGMMDTVENRPWTHTFTGLPLFADGELARYTLREEVLGEFKYSEEYTDGYQYYDVTYSDMAYLNESGAATTDTDEVKTIVLNVYNTRSSGALAIRKSDENGMPLEGATFNLYLADGSATPPQVSAGANGNVLADLNVIKNGVSNANGLVSFGSMPAGNYYIVEYKAPANYANNDALYRLSFNGNECKMEVWTGDAWSTVPGNKIVNVRSTVDVTITKQVAGNMGDRNRSFTFTVLSSEAMGAGSGYTLSEGGQTATFTLSHGQAVTLSDVPVGAVLTLSEQGAEGYERTITVNGETADDTITVRDGENDVLVTNEKNASPDTGILLDSLPYVLILALILGIGVIAFIRKRAEQDED